MRDLCALTQICFVWLGYALLGGRAAQVAALAVPQEYLEDQVVLLDQFLPKSVNFY